MSNLQRTLPQTILNKDAEIQALKAQVANQQAQLHLQITQKDALKIQYDNLIANLSVAIPTLDENGLSDFVRHSFHDHLTRENIDAIDRAVHERKWQWTNAAFQRQGTQ